MWTYDDESLLLFLNLDIFLKNSTPGEFAYIKLKIKLRFNYAKVS